MLDDRSRRTLGEFSVQTAIGGALLVGLSVLTEQSATALLQSGTRVFQFYALIDCLRAARVRDLVAGPNLNLWDQAAAYGLCAVSLDILARMVSSGS